MNFVDEPVFQFASAETSVSALQSRNTARRERHRHTSNASQSLPPNHHPARTRVTHTLFLHVTISIVAATTTAEAATAGEATRDKCQGEAERDLRNQYHARTRRDTTRGKHVLEQEERKNHHDTATTAVTATKQQKSTERKRDMLAPSGEGQ